MEMQQIRYFLAVTRTLNFTRAAEECNVSQPALTRAVQALEGELGGPLIVRERQHTHLTDLGQRMLPLLQQCFDSALSAKAIANSVKTGEIAPLLLAFTPSINVALIADPFRELTNAHPGVEFRMHRGSTEEVMRFLKDGVAELAIAGPITQSWERLDVWPLFSEPFELVAHHENPVAMNNRLSLSDLGKERIVMRAGCEVADDFKAALEEEGVRLDRVHEVPTAHDALALAEANLGVCLMPATGPYSDKLRRIRLEDLNLRRKVSVYGVAGRRRSPAATTFLNLLRAREWPVYDV